MMMCAKVDENRNSCTVYLVLLNCSCHYHGIMIKKLFKNENEKYAMMMYPNPKNTLLLYSIQLGRKDSIIFSMSKGFKEKL